MSVKSSEFGIVHFPAVSEIEKLGWYVTYAVTMATTPHYAQERFWDPVTGTQLWNDGRRSHFFELLRVEEGAAELRTEQIRHARLEPGDLMLIVPYQWHAFRADPETGLRETYVIFNGSDPRWLLSNGYISPNSPVIRPDDPREIERVFADIRDFAAKNDGAMASPREQWWMSGLVYHALSVVLRTMPMAAGAVSYDSIPHEVLELVNYIKDNSCCDVDIGQVARLSSQAITGRRRQFKRYMGISPHQYHLRERMRLAQDLLRAPNLTVADVAGVLGFADPGYFTRVFKNHFGCCPERWREAIRRGE